MVAITTSKAAFIVVVLLCDLSADGIPLEDFYPFGTDAGDTLLQPGANVKAPPTSLPSPFPFFGVDHMNIIVSLHRLWVIQ